MDKICIFMCVLIVLHTNGNGTAVDFSNSQAL